MINQLSGKNKINSIVFAFAAGLYFAILQFAYYFVLEAYFTSRSISFFIATFFWLIGFLIGLNIHQKLNDQWLAILSISGYYIFYFINNIFPFKSFIVGFLIVCVLVSGAFPGYFFNRYNSQFRKVKDFFFIENNGFILGIIISYFGSIKAGKYFIIFFPIFSFGLLCISYYFREKNIISDN